jgi:hypothetical protein
MTDQLGVPGGVDLTRPNVARMYDYYLGHARTTCPPTAPLPKR